ncbi:CDP-diacylglycerol-inositol 3-phosphatidyltransferase [Ceratobasidium sp. 392]|nr:CDP-diacylglycerol-inositol 3-phosphatidyltransferase [Ceratobasidium sp. 392]
MRRSSSLDPSAKASLDRRRRGSDIVDGKLALDLATHTYDENVYLFVPNLIASRYTSYATLFQMLITLDFSSHYMHMYSSLVTGSKSHKAVTSDVSRILWYYYNNSLTLFIFCACNELFFVALYLLSFGPYTPIGGPFASLSQALLTFQPTGKPIPELAIAAQYIATISWPHLLALISFPICFGKNIINIVQLWKASKMLVGVDLADRAKEREARMHTIKED